MLNSHGFRGLILCRCLIDTLRYTLAGNYPLDFKHYSISATDSLKTLLD